MELHHDPHYPVADDETISSVSQSLLDSMEHDRSHDQSQTDGGIDEGLLFGQDSHRTHITEMQIDEVDLHSQRSTTDPREHSPLDSTPNAPFQPTSQQRHFKAKFTRPVSAEGDIQTGFTFGKAPIPKTLDLTVGRKPATSATTKPDDPVSSQSLQSRLCSSQVQQQNESSPSASVTYNSHQGRSNIQSSNRSKTPLGDFNAPMRTTASPNHLEDEIPQELDEHTLDNIQRRPPHTAQESQSAIPKDILPILRTSFASSTATAPQLGTTQMTTLSVSEAGRLPSQTAHDRAGIDSLPLHNHDVAQNATGSPLHQLRPIHIARNGNHIPIADTPHESIQPGRKVNKRKPATKKRSVTGKASVNVVEAVPAQDSATSIAVEPPTEEEQFLEALWMRYQKQQHQRKIEQAQLKYTAAELTHAQEAIGTLQTRLLEMKRCAETQQAELDGNKSRMAVWQTKIGKLTAHINGLSKDHMQLKQDSICIRDRQEEITRDKASIDSAVKEVHQYVNDGKLAELNEVKTKAEHRIRLLEQTVENQERQLEEDWDLLRAERERNFRLEAEIVKFSDKHDELMRDVVTHRQTVSNQLSELLTACETRQVTSNPENDIQMGSRLEECINLIKELRDSDKVTPSDFQKLDSSVRNYAERITKTIEKVTKTTDSARTRQQTFESEVQSKLDSLSAGVKSEQSLSEQVAELRELKATIRERLQASEIALAEARQHSHGLQQKEQLLRQRITDLEVETATLRSQPKENLLSVLRQKELEDRNSQLVAEIEKAHEDAREAVELSQGQAQSLDKREEQINCLNAQLEDIRATLTTLREEKSASEHRAAAHCDEIRNQILKATDVEKTTILNEHANTLCQLKYQKDEADNHAQELSRQLTALKNAEGNKSQTSSVLRAQCANLEIQNGEKDSRIASLQENIRHAAEVNQSKDAELASLKQVTAILTKEVESKDAEITALRKTNSELVQDHMRTREKSAAMISEADVKAAHILAEAQDLLKGFDETIVLPKTLADAMVHLKQVLTSIKKDRQLVLDANSAAGQSNGVSSSETKASDRGNGTPGKLRRRANRGVFSQENANRVMHTDENDRQGGVVVQQSKIEETTFHSRNVKTTFSSLGADKTRITPFSQIGQSDPAASSSPLEDVSELFTPTPVKQNAQQKYPPLRATQRPRDETREKEFQSDEISKSVRAGPARRASHRPSSGLPSHSLTSKRMSESKPRTPHAGKTPTPQAEKGSMLGGRNVAFDDPTAAGAAFGRMKTSKTQVTTDSSSQIPASPRSILKEPTNFKRSAAAAGFGSNSRAGKHMKLSESQRNSLGPIIGDSKSPRKTTRRSGGGRVSKEREYLERFSQELN